MKCVYCVRAKTEVVNSREAKRGAITWRRRKCLNCNKLFTTTEHGYINNIFVIKSSGRRQRFVYEKLFASLFSVLNNTKNRDNGNSALIAKKISEKVTQKILSTVTGKEIKTEHIITFTYFELKKVDTAFAEHYIYYSDYRRKVGLKLAK